MQNKPKRLRITPEGEQMLIELSETYGVSQSKILEEGVRYLYELEKFGKGNNIRLKDGGKTNRRPKLAKELEAFKRP